MPSCRGRGNLTEETLNPVVQTAAAITFFLPPARQPRFHRRLNHGTFLLPSAAAAPSRPSPSSPAPARHQHLPIAAAMAAEIITNQQHLVALLPRNDVGLTIHLVSLGQLRTASECYGMLRQKSYPLNWSCAKLDMLEGFATLATVLFTIRDELLNEATASPFDAVLEEDLLEAFLMIKEKASHLCQPRIPGMKPLLRQAVIDLGNHLFCTSRDVLNNSQTLLSYQNDFQDFIARIDNVLDQQMIF